MKPSLDTSIADWFAANSDGEFPPPEHGAPYTVIGPSSRTEHIIYSAKCQVILRTFGDHAVPDDFSMICRYGLPGDADLGWMREIIGTRRLIFLGDMDPVDLLVFAWLRTQLGPSGVAFLGVGDTLLKSLGLTISELSVIPLAPSEQRVFPLLETVFADLRETAGQRCSELLKKGWKIELEGVANATTLAASKLCQTILQSVV